MSHCVSVGRHGDSCQRKHSLYACFCYMKGKIREKERKGNGGRERERKREGDGEREHRIICCINQSK